jgi:hypothetical protein
VATPLKNGALCAALASVYWLAPGVVSRPIKINVNVIASRTKFLECFIAV